MIGGAKGIGIGIDFGIPNQYCRATSKPYIEKDVLDSLRVVASAYGKSNDDADRSIVKNLVDASNPFIISNAAFKLNSGFGEYKEDFTSWRIYPNIKVTDNVITTNGNFNSIWFIYKHSSESKINEMNIKVSGIPKGGKILYFYISDETANLPIAYTIPKDGIYHLPESKINNNRVSVGFTVESSYDWNNIRIEQIPSFEGAFVTDGIDDLITSTKTVQEMGITDEVTVVSMIHQIDLNSTYTIATTNYIENSNSREHVRSDVYYYGKTGIYGYSASLINNTKSDIKNILGDEADYYVKSTNSLQTIFDAKFSVVGRISELSEASQVAWYWTIIANKVLTTDQINQVIAYFNLDRTLKPDILCDVKKQGITNENHAEFGDKLIDFSGNGRDIQLNNLAWKGGSGIAAKQYETFKDWTNTPYQTSTVTEIDEFTRVVDSTSNAYWVSMINRTSDFDKVHDSINIVLYQDDMLLVHECKYKIDENVTTKALYETLKSGVNTITLATIDKFTDIPEDAEIMGLGEWVNPKSNKGSVKITLLPSYKGGLLLDGVNDFGKVTGMPVYKDYTVVTDREIFANIGAISSKNNPGAFVETAGNSVYSFGQATSGLNFISTRSISYLSKYSYCGQSITAGAAEDGTDMWLGTIRDNDSRFFNGAIYSLMSFPYSMSEFLIERQLKKHKLGTLYPDMVEFRPIVKSNVKWDIIEIWQGDKSLYRPTVNDNKTGIYLAKDSTIGIYVKPYVGQKVSKIVYNGVSYTDLKVNSNGFYYKVVPITKSPQKITMTIEQDENYVQWNPVINSNIEYKKALYYTVTNGVWTRINSGDYINIKERIAIAIFPNGIDELVSVTSSDLNNISVIGINNNGEFYYFLANLTSNSPQNIDITIDEYIRYEDIVQPYPVIFQITDRNTNQRYSWGDKIKVGSSIRLSQGEKPNLLSGLYSIKSYEYEGETYSYNQLTNLNIILTKQSISLSCNKTWLLDDNEPKCILSPRLLRIPNSSYKILGYIPDISGHGNHGKINNSAYAEGSGVNEDGSYQFDGVDDFVTIPTLSSGGKQVLMKINWQSGNGDVLYDQRTSTEGLFAITAASETIAYNYRNAGGNTYIDGVLNKHILSEELASITHNIILNNDYTVTNSNIFIGTNYANTVYAKMSLYDFMLFDDISTDDKIKELNEYVGIEAKVELPPYYWDTYGKTNLDADKATIQQRGVAIGDYDLTNYSHAYEGMSGYNGYPVVFGANKTWANESNGYVTSITSNTIHITNVLNPGLALLYSYVKYNGNLQNIKEIPPFKIEIKGLEGRSKFIYKYLATSDATKETNLFLGNGTHELPKSFLPTEALINDTVVGFSISPIEEGVTNFLSDITIEVLPKYENGLVYDGIEDYSVNTNIPALTDYTYIYKRTIINIPTNVATLLKGADKTNGGAFIADYGNKWQFNFGQYNTIQGIADGINWQTVNSFNGTSINKGENTDDSGITVAKFSNGYTSMVFYKLILYPKTISLLEINFLKNLMEKDEIIDLTNPIFIQ